MASPPDIFSTDAPVVFVPVRHHSPTAAMATRDLIESIRPSVVLIEGPSDFNERLAELFLPHELPIAIYSYLRTPDNRRRGGYYPFCVYSPEWQGLLAAQTVGATVRFIDLPYADIADADAVANRYADADFRRSQYVQAICRKLGVESFDAVWDLFFELDREMSPSDYLRRAHQFCGQMRQIEKRSTEVDRRREAFMAGQIRSALAETDGPVVVITGGYHSVALHARLYGSDDGSLVDPPEFQPAAVSASGAERGIALTPYSYERLDALTGYNAGMPNPAYYHRLWEDRLAKRPIDHRHLLFEVARELRSRKQRVSSADLIAAETCAMALARMRGHAEVWRNDLVDGLAGAVIKDELASGGTHPLLDAIHLVLRGNARGVLAAGTLRPPLVLDLQATLAQNDLQPQHKAADLRLDLCVESDRERSRLLHRLRILGIAGFARTGGTDFRSRDDLSNLWEAWALRWTPEFEPSAIEAARYGATVAEAAAARLSETAAAIGRSAEQAAILLLDASLAELNGVASELHARLTAIVNQDGDFLSMSVALGHLLYLYQFDETMGTQGRADIGSILVEVFDRGVWLLEILGQTTDADGKMVAGVRFLLDTFERCSRSLSLDRMEFLEALHRVAEDRSQGAAIRGASIGALWALNAATAQQAQAALKLFSDPQGLGDFLTGLFTTAREVVQREPQLVHAVDELLVGYADDEFLVALPSLRLAFTYFTPREKHYIASSLLKALGITKVENVAAIAVRPEDAARAFAIESAIFAALGQFGLRGAD